MKNSILIFVQIALAAFVFSCDTPKKEGTSDETKVEQKESKTPTTPFEKSLSHHGGLDTWNSYGTLTFERISESGNSTHIIDLKNRNEKIINPTSTLTFASEGFWTDATDEKTRANLKGTRFYKNLWFYFFGLPFVTADPGANQQDLPEATLDGKTYNRVKITFGENIGDAPDDQYILWLDQQTGQLELINYSVTYGRGASASEKYNAIVFNEWQEVNGLKVPKKFKGHVWEDNKLGDVKYEFEFGNISFEKARPSVNTFDTPEGAAFLAY